MPQEEVRSGEQLKKRIKSSVCQDSLGCLYIFGGVFQDLSFSQELAKFDPKTMTWEVLCSGN